MEPFNESSSDFCYFMRSQEGCHFTSETQLKIIRILYPKLMVSGLETVISASDNTGIAVLINVMRVYKSAGDIFEKVGHLNTQTYSSTNDDWIEANKLISSIGKPFWQSETGSGGSKDQTLSRTLS